MKLLINTTTKQLIARKDMIDKFCSSYNDSFEGRGFGNIESLNQQQFWDLFGEWAEGVIECGEIIVIDSESELYAFEPTELELKIRKN